MSHKLKFEQLPGYDGHSVYGGALRFIGEEDVDWISSWGIGNGNGLPRLKFFAADVFDVLYGVDEDGVVSIFWTETGDVENIGVTMDEFFSLIRDDPDSTIGYSLYVDAVGKMGKPDFDQSFALKVETALGGKMSVDNMYLCNRAVHMRQLGELARKISGHPVGTKYVPAGN